MKYLFYFIYVIVWGQDPSFKMQEDTNDKGNMNLLGLKIKLMYI